MVRLDFYIYVIFRLDGSPCYIGKGCGNRARRLTRRNARLQRIIDGCSGEPPVVIIRDGLSEAAAFEIEAALIRAVGRGRNGPLVNQTDGGEGPSGWRHNSLSKAKIAAGHTPERRARAAELARSRAGWKMPQAARERMSRTRTGRKRPPEECQAIRERLLGKPIPDETKKKISATLTGRKLGAQSSEHVAARAASRKRTILTRMAAML